METRREFGRVRATMVRGDYSVATVTPPGRVSEVVLAFFDPRTGEDGDVAVRRFRDVRDVEETAWWSLNQGKFGLRRRLSPAVALFEALRDAVPEQAEAWRVLYRDARAAGADVEEAILDAVTEMYLAPATEDEPEMPASRPVAVPPAAKPVLDRLIQVLEERAAAGAEARAAEAKAGWDATP